MNRYYEMDVEQQYYHWLCDLVHIDQIDISYKILAKDLYKKTFYSLIPHDENRASDGLQLREEYLENYPKSMCIEGECSVLEMLIGLARRMDFATSDPYEDDSNDKTAYWFWEMIDNLGLIVFDDESYVELNGDIYVDMIVDQFLDRGYQEDGKGGLFPLHAKCGDQRKVEIWYQMNSYLMEREVV